MNVGALLKTIKKFGTTIIDVEEAIMNVGELLKAMEGFDNNSCNGHIFRADCSQYYNPDRQVVGQSIKLCRLKRLSCPGCDRCGYLYDLLDDIGEDPIEGIESAEHGLVYELYGVFSPAGTFDLEPEYEGLAIREIKEEQLQKHAPRIRKKTKV